MPEKHITIALTDDHVIVRKGFKDIINSFGDFKVTIEANDGEELLQKLAVPPIPDICIMDISMPGMNGYDTIVALRSEYPTIKVLILTMYNNEFAVLKMLRNGASGYLLKNCHPADLKTALLAIHSQGYYHSDFVSGRAFKSLESEESQLPRISEKEQQFLELCCKDVNYKQMSEQMSCSPRTIEGYRDTLFTKLNVRTRTALAMYVIQIGMVSFNDRL